MSVRAMAWAWDQSVGHPTRKLVLMALADHADDAGRCWPGADTVAGKVGVGERTVRRHIEALAEGGYLTQAKRIRRDDGTLGSWILVLHLDGGDHRSPVSGGPNTPRNSTGHPCPEDTNVLRTKLCPDRTVVVGREKNAHAHGNPDPAPTPSVESAPAPEAGPETPPPTRERETSTVVAPFRPVRPGDPGPDQHPPVPADALTDALDAYLAARGVSAVSAHAYRATVGGWLDGMDPSVWRPRGLPAVPPEDRRALVVTALRELLAGDENGMAGGPGHTRNLRTKIQILARMRAVEAPGPEDGPDEMPAGDRRARAVYDALADMDLGASYAD